ncbi:MAG: ABC transporter substrate-binding protein [Tepidisphaeraceae bacterium]
MFRNALILALLALIVALPFVFRQKAIDGDWKPGDPTIVIISPHNEAIRYEFERAFNRWRRHKSLPPVKIDWRNIGGATEIGRYLDSEYASRSRPWLQANFPDLPSTAGELLVRDTKPTDAKIAAAWEAFRATDDASKFSIGVDIWFGGGWFDLDGARRKGELVAPWPRGQESPAIQDAIANIPTNLGGEPWRSDYVFGTVISTFGLVYNIDRLHQLGVPESDWPKRWDDLANPVYIGQVGVTDPTKSGSIAKAFEMIIHQKMHDRVVADLKLTEQQIAENEKRIAKFIADVAMERSKPAPRGEVPEDLKPYQASLEAGWIDGIRLVQRIGANARYFTDSATKVSIDVSMGDATVGMSIDFYGRYQAQTMTAPDGTERMRYRNPIGGTSASCDPIALLRGAGGSADGATDAERKANQKITRDAAMSFIEFVLSPEGQQLWTYRPGSPEGPEKYALRRVPIRRDFFASTQPAEQAKHMKHVGYSVDRLDDPTIDPFQMSKGFTYYARWTGEHFGVQRDIIRAMCMDSGDELRAAWRAINQPGRRYDLATDPALQVMSTLPTVQLTDKTKKVVEQPLTWRTAPDIRRNFDNMEYMRLWTAAFRDQYNRAADLANQAPPLTTGH